jgi:hypothetical protein
METHARNSTLSSNTNHQEEVKDLMRGEYVNPVLTTTRRVVEQSKIISINSDKLIETAEKWANQDFVVPSWNEPIFPKGANNAIIDFMFTTSSIDFQFTWRDTGKKYMFITNDGTQYSGAYGMHAALNEAINCGAPILDGAYLADMNIYRARSIFEKSGPIPMLAERAQILHEVGTVLVKKYGGHFHNLVSESENRIFNHGKGVVERLTEDFPSFRDYAVYDGETVFFNKRAQLAPALVEGRFLGEGKELFPQSDVEALTIFADYQLPKILNKMGILVYPQQLTDRIAKRELIGKDSREEIEMRACTIWAAKMLEKKINQINPSKRINALHMDFKLWSEGRSIQGVEHHFTETTAY